MATICVFERFCFSFLVLARLVSSKCESDQLPVAKMCQNSRVSGPAVYIDTSDAMLTDHTKNTTLCQCTATLANANFFSADISGPQSICGSILKFQIPNKGIKTSDENCGLTKHTLLEVRGEQNAVNITLKKLHTPFEADFCARLTLDLCLDDEYQCHVDGLCIPRKRVCDSNPDCQNQDDELNCAQNVCAEGTMKCGDDQCHVSCKDVIKTSTNLTGQTSDALKPLIEVVCVQSTHFSTTTPTTTTTTTTTPQPTTTTTTTTPPPTTTTKTTTPKITTPTTTTPITTTPATTTLVTTTTPSTTTSPTTTETPPQATTASTLPSYEDTESLDFSSISEETTAHNVLGDIEHGKHQTSLDKPVNDKKSILTNPVALAGIIVGAVACVVITSLIIYAVRRRLKKKNSHDIPPSDLWIPSKGEPNELSPMNEIL